MGKTKTFITVIPFQLHDKGGDKSKDNLRSVVYSAEGNSKLEYGATGFPIIPAINGYTEAGDKVRVIAILIDGENYRYNYDTYFVPEVTALTSAKQLDFSGVEIIGKADSEDIETQLKLFSDIIDVINDDEEICACLTYGRKIEPIVETMALNYAYKLKKNVSIGCIVYGLGHANSDGKTPIYDVTALFFTNTMVDKLAEMKVKDPRSAIKALLGVGDGDDE